MAIGGKIDIHAWYESFVGSNQTREYQHDDAYWTLYRRELASSRGDVTA